MKEARKRWHFSAYDRSVLNRQLKLTRSSIFTSVTVDMSIEKGVKGDGEVKEVKRNDAIHGTRSKVWEIHETCVECKNPTRRFIFYLKENEHGRFLKIKQTGTEPTSKTNLTMSLAAVVELCNHLPTIDNISRSQQSSDSQGLISTTRMRDSSKHFFLDLRENHLGKFLDVTDTLNRKRIRFPSHCIVAIHKALVDVVIFSLQNPQKKDQPF